MTFILNVCKVCDMDNKKVLVVEDDQLLRELYVETLKDEGYIVDSAVDGEEGLTKITQGGWDLILIDIIMPKMSGLETMTKAQASSPSIPNKKVIFLTNLDKTEEIKEALRLGNGYLIKSQITPGDLINEVKVYLKD